MPTTSPAQHRLMEAAAHTPGGYGGVPHSIGKEFVKADAEWNESDHPRDEDGKFVAGGGSLYSHLANHEDLGTFEQEVNRLAKEHPSLSNELYKEVSNLGYNPEKYGLKRENNKEKAAKHKPSDAGEEKEGNVDDSFGEYERMAAWKIEPPHEVRDQKKLEDLAEKMRTSGWQGRPILAIDLGQGPEALTGSHRIAAAKMAGIDVPVIMVDDDVANYEDENGKNIRDMMYESVDDMANFLANAGDSDASNLAMAEHKEQEKGYWRKDSIESSIFETELDIAKAIRDGKLSSPQRIGNLWLFDLRITGTGASYREKHDEYVYRPPEHYLNKEFMERCQGLPVIFEHPEKSMLDTDEYRQRNVGSIVLPYIPTREDDAHMTDEVWGIARIYDGDAAELMQTSHVSTSPAVNLGAAGDSRSVAMDDGSTLLIEGKPPYLDHLAVCAVGVWDKGGEPRGVS